jgi:hypothetical protein
MQAGYYSSNHITRRLTHLQHGFLGVEMDVKEYLKLQTLEIERHKWIESEKAGKDLGVDAVIDWILKYADVFSDDFSESPGCGAKPELKSNALVSVSKT